MSKIKAINISNLSGERTVYVNQAILNKNKGIINDRYYENFKNNYEQVTLMESENIDYFNNITNGKLNYKDFRRNIVTSDIVLNDIMNRKIQINDALLKVRQLCQPCRYLQDKLKIDSLVKLLFNKSGVRAEIIKSGTISTFDQIKIIK